jgi:hypothetical protein
MLIAFALITLAHFEFHAHFLFSHSITHFGFFFPRCFFDSFFGFFSGRVGFPYHTRYSRLILTDKNTHIRNTNRNDVDLQHLHRSTGMTHIIITRNSNSRSIFQRTNNLTKELTIECKIIALIESEIHVQRIKFIKNPKTSVFVVNERFSNHRDRPLQ